MFVKSELLCSVCLWNLRFIVLLYVYVGFYLFGSNSGVNLRVVITCVTSSNCVFMCEIVSDVGYGQGNAILHNSKITKKY